uniref:RING-type E3 ubiquitin transferase n=1 Tax=Pristionchus pacificus TaxID=54126 RepID=A0A2A6BAP4_PRIPA|eukprot:PDM62952.1 strd-1 [Pristionchus pacificus]
MAPQGQGLKWAEVLCCPLCVKVFSRHKQAVNLFCSHAVCTDCIEKKMDDEHICLTDKIEGKLPLSVLPRNKAMMSIVGVDVQQGLESFIDHDETLQRDDLFVMQNIDDSLCGVASYLRKIESERGGSVWSEVMSRTVQRKIVHLICLQLAEPSGRLRAARQARQIAERILCEVMLGSQNQQSLSHQLWTAVRARGCQFLGPAMQEDVLNLILLTMSHNALIARKTLVMYVVKRLSETYPQTSKTCVGHVVQLLYRASCFNVLKRDGESSLMQLKEEYTVYDSLRREHDAQIVSIAIDAGLRIAPEQWSALLYGDHDHRSHMQSIIDKLQSTASFTNGIEDLRKMADGDELMESTVEGLRAVDELTRSIQEDASLLSVDWRPLRKVLEALRELVDRYADVLTRRNQARADFLQQAVADGSDKAAANQAARSLIRPVAAPEAVERMGGWNGAEGGSPPGGANTLTMFKTKMLKNMSLSGPSELSEMEQLHMRRDEIISRLGPLSLEQDDILNGPSTSGGHGDNDDAHVAYTVASSVLDDRISDLMQANASSSNPIIELPPMPPGYTPVINSTTTSEETLGVLSELALGDAAGAASNASVKARTSSLTTTTTTVRTACPAYAFHTTADGCTTATVQADCSTMHVRDTISEPVATPVIVPSNSVVLYAPASEGAPGAVVAANGAVVAPSGAVLTPAPAPGATFETTPESLTRDAARLPMVIQPLSQINPVQAEDPQDIVSSTLDRIVDVREKLTEVDGAASTVVKTQLEVELEIASRQIEQLDPLTTQNCLLKELEAVERKIEEIVAEPKRHGDIVFGEILGSMDRVGLGIGKGFAKFVPKAIRLDEIDPDQYAATVTTTPHNYLQREVAALRLARHKVLLRLEACFVRGAFAYELYPLADLGSAEQIISAHYSAGLPERAIGSIADSILAALQYLHDRHIVHRGIRASNILIDRTAGVRLAGMRHARQLPTSGNRRLHDYDREMMDGMLWLAPEVLAQDLNGYDCRSDVYSVGVALTEMANGFPPFSDMERLEMLFEKLRGTTPRLLDSTTMPDPREDPARSCRTFSTTFHDAAEICLRAAVATRNMCKLNIGVVDDDIKQITVFTYRSDTMLDNNYCLYGRKVLIRHSAIDPFRPSATAMREHPFVSKCSRKPIQVLLQDARPIDTSKFGPEPQDAEMQSMKPVPSAMEIDDEGWDF